MAREKRDLQNDRSRHGWNVRPLNSTEQKQVPAFEAFPTQNWEKTAAEVELDNIIDNMPDHHEDRELDPQTLSRFHELMAIVEQEGADRAFKLVPKPSGWKPGYATNWS